MEYRLLPHPSSPVMPIDSITATVQRSADARLSLTYSLSGDIASIAMPVLMPTERADDLWKTTCFEAFLKIPGSDQYVEFNFSPSARWAGYMFTGYRAGRRDLHCASMPRIDMRAGLHAFDLSVVVDMSGMEEKAWQTSDLKVGLSAVIETLDRQKSYWAIAHPAGSKTPDFHHGDCFAGFLRAPGDA